MSYFGGTTLIDSLRLSSLCLSNAKACVLLLAGSSKAGSPSSGKDLSPLILSLCPSDRVLFLFIAIFLLSGNILLKIFLFVKAEPYNSSSTFLPVGLYW